MTRFELHILEWKNCTRCHYADRRRKVVLGRGDCLPCDVVFVGEAPGESEDVHGVPFYGQAGILIDEIVARALPSGVTKAFNNLTGCLPTDIETGEKGEPDDDCVKVCSPRLIDFISIAKPKLIVTVGKLAKEWLDQSTKRSIQMPAKIPMVDIIHPAAILRQPFVQRDLSVQQCVIVVKKAVRKHVLGEDD